MGLHLPPTLHPSAELHSAALSQVLGCDWTHRNVTIRAATELTWGVLPALALYTNSLTPHQNPMRWAIHYPRIVSEECKAQTGSATCQRSHRSLEDSTYHREEQVPPQAQLGGLREQGKDI